VAEERKHPLASTQKEIKAQREKLRKRLKKWHETQMDLMPVAYDASIKQSPPDIEHKHLCLPSDFTGEQQTAVAMEFKVEEGKLREGQAYDCLRAVQTAVKTIRALMDKKQKNARGQDANTRAMSYIVEAQKRRDHYMTMYASARCAMIALRSLDKDDPNGPFPPLTLEDTFMKSRQRKRGLGDSRRVDGNLWHRHGHTVGTSEQPANNVDSEWVSEEESSACKCHHHCYLCF